MDRQPYPFTGLPTFNTNITNESLDVFVQVLLDSEWKKYLNLDKENISTDILKLKKISLVI